MTKAGERQGRKGPNDQKESVLSIQSYNPQPPRRTRHPDCCCENPLRTNRRASKVGSEEILGIAIMWDIGLQTVRLRDWHWGGLPPRLLPYKARPWCHSP